MKIAQLIIMSLFGAMPLMVHSQPPMERPIEEPMGDRMGHPMDEIHGDRGENSFRPVSPVQKWMRHLEESNPEEFNRLHTLRMQDPESFRKEARAFMQKEFMDKLAQERPAVKEAISQLSEDDRAWLIDRIARPDMPPQDGRQHGDRGDMPRDAQMRNRELVHQYRQASTEEEKNSIKQELRGQLSELYDQRIEQRSKQLAETEQKLDAIRKTITQGQEGKDAFIDEKLEAWLNGPPPENDRHDHDHRPPPPDDEPP